MYVAEGVVYVVVGALAVGVAVGIGGRTTDERGALEVIGTQPLLGRVLLILSYPSPQGERRFTALCVKRAVNRAQREEGNGCRRPRIGAS